MLGSLQSMLGGNYHDGSLLANHNGGQMASNAYQSMMNNYNSQQAQSALAHQYNQNIVAVTPDWVINGKIFRTARDAANELFPTDCPEKTHFLLKYE